MLNTLRNSIFRPIAWVARTYNEFQYQPFLAEDKWHRSDRLRVLLKRDQERKKLDNLWNLSIKEQEDEIEKEKVRIMKKVFLEDLYKPDFDVDKTIEKVDELEYRKKLQLLEIQEGKTNPELVTYEKLKFAALKNEPGAVEAFEKYKATRSYKGDASKFLLGEEDNSLVSKVGRVLGISHQKRNEV